MERKRPSPPLSGAGCRDLRWTLHNAENVTLSGLYVYPIKSCAGVSLQGADLSATGLRHDRRWMLVDETGEVMSQGDHPRMALISVHLSAEHLKYRYNRTTRTCKTCVSGATRTGERS